MTATWLCEKCGTRTDVTGRPPGEPFTCPVCGRRGVVGGTPAEVDRAEAELTRPLGRRITLAVLIATVVLGVVFAGLGRMILVAQARNKTAEAQALLQRLCTNVRETHGQTGEWVAAGPSPKKIPGKNKAEFPVDPAFEKLGFAPGLVRYQYQVVVEGNPVGDAKIHCLARGDLDEDGVTSLGEVTLDEHQMPTSIHWTQELE